MAPLLEKFMGRLRNSDGNKLPDGIKIIDINNVSFQSALGSNEYIFNVWFKHHTGIPNRTTFSYRLKNLQQCIDIKAEMDREYELDDGNLLEANDETPFGEEPAETVSSLVEERSDTPFNEFTRE